MPAALNLSLTISPVTAAPEESDGSVTFKMVVSAGAKTCLPDASATVSIRPAGPVESMDVSVQGLPPNTEFDFFVIEVPKAPFGVSWYQGDVQTDKHGRGHQQFVGRFSIETFAVAPGSARAGCVRQRTVPGRQSEPGVQPSADLPSRPLVWSAGGGPCGGVPRHGDSLQR